MNIKSVEYNFDYVAGKASLLVNNVEIASGLNPRLVGEISERLVAAVSGSQTAEAKPLETMSPPPAENDPVAIGSRNLRLWHWQMAMAKRDQAKLTRVFYGSRKSDEAKAYDAEADFHIKAVQVLNDAPGCQQTTAEQDAKKNGMTS